MVQGHVQIVAGPHLADARPGVALVDLPHRVPAAGEGLTVLDEHRAEGDGKEQVVLLHELPHALLGVLLAHAQIDEVALAVDEQGVHTVIQGVAAGVMPGLHAVELPVPGHDAHVPEAVKVRVHGHHRVALLGQIAGEVLVAGVKAVVRHLAAELAGIGDLHLGEGAAHAVHVLLPEDHQDGIVQIIFDIPGVNAPVEAHVGVEGHHLVLPQQAPVPGLLDHRQDLLRLIHADLAVAGGVGRGAGVGVLGDGVADRLRRGLRGGLRRGLGRGLRRGLRAEGGGQRLRLRSARGHHGRRRRLRRGGRARRRGKALPGQPAHEEQQGQGSRQTQQSQGQLRARAPPILFSAPPASAHGPLSSPPPFRRAFSFFREYRSGKGRKKQVFFRSDNGQIPYCMIELKCIGIFTPSPSRI